MGFYYDNIVPHLVNLAMRNRLLKAYRERIVGLAEGRVLEIGIGSGMNLPFYTERATQILGLEPHPKLLEMSSPKSRCDRATLIQGTAESIPLDRASVDTILVTWTLCSIPDLAMALSEMHRVLKPSGQLLLVEHGLAPDEKVRAWQHRLTPLWKRLTSGCHLGSGAKAASQGRWTSAFGGLPGSCRGVALSWHREMVTSVFDIAFPAGVIVLTMWIDQRPSFVGAPTARAIPAKSAIAAVESSKVLILSLLDPHIMCISRLCRYIEAKLFILGRRISVSDKLDPHLWVKLCYFRTLTHI